MPAKKVSGQLNTEYIKKNYKDMGLQIIQDSSGKATGVYIPISEWRERKKQYKDLEALEYEEPTKAQILQGLQEAAEQVRQHKQGKIKLKTAQELINEL
jgi:hypothetical protein